VRLPVRLPVCAIVATFAIAPLVGAQQREDDLHPARAVTDTAPASAFFPLSVPDVSLGATPDGRYRLLAQRIDSVSAVGSQLATPSILRDEISTTASRIVLFSQLERAVGFGVAPSAFANSHSAYGSANWLSVVSLAGFTGLARNSLLVPDETDETVLGSLRTAGEWAGMATAAGGASWLISSLARHPMCLGRLACHRPAAETQSR
jgi:hypothetical protein